MDTLSYRYCYCIPGSSLYWIFNRARKRRKPCFQPSSHYFWVSTVIILTAGTLFVMWLGEKITDKGLGNGTSIIIMIGILARLPQTFMQELTAKQTRGGGGLLIFLD